MASPAQKAAQQAMIMAAAACRGRTGDARKKCMRTALNASHAKLSGVRARHRR